MTLVGPAIGVLSVRLFTTVMGSRLFELRFAS
jgi:hypothetical protein